MARRNESQKTVDGVLCSGDFMECIIGFKEPFSLCPSMGDGRKPLNFKRHFTLDLSTALQKRFFARHI